MKHTKFYSVMKSNSGGIDVYLTQWTEMHNTYNTEWVANFYDNEAAREFAKWRNEKKQEMEEIEQSRWSLGVADRE